MKTSFILSALAVCALVAAVPGQADTPTNSKTEPVKLTKANYELATHWTAAKVNKLVFDRAVTPHWLETGDRFWYSYETSHGRHFYLVDPAKKTKVPVFDNAKMAAMLTEITRTPYDAQHLPIRTIKFVKNDTVVEFELQAERDADINGTQKVIGGDIQTDQIITGGAPEADERCAPAWRTWRRRSGESSDEDALLPVRSRHFEAHPANRVHAGTTQASLGLHLAGRKNYRLREKE